MFFASDLRPRSQEDSSAGKVWAAAEFEDAGDRSKFLKLMGAFKGKGGGALAAGAGAGAPTAAGSPAAADLAKAKGVDLETQRKLQHDLGMQFVFR